MSRLVLVPEIGWDKKAACLGSDPDLFFSEAVDKVAAAKEICSTCPVIGPCTRDWMAMPEHMKEVPQIRGGLTTTELYELQNGDQS